MSDIIPPTGTGNLKTPSPNTQDQRAAYDGSHADSSTDTYHGTNPHIPAATGPGSGEPTGAANAHSDRDPVMHTNYGRSDNGAEQRHGPYGAKHSSTPDVTTPPPHGHTGRKY